MPTILDISPLISPDLAVWPGDVPFSQETRLSHDRGDGLDLSSIRTTLHMGAHADAPRHIMPDGRGMDEVDLDPYIGPCEVIEMKLTPRSQILPENMPAPIRTPRVLFKTGSYPDPQRFTGDFVGLSVELIRHLESQECRLVGIDTPSVDPFHSRAFECHHLLLETGLCVLEGLDLALVEPGLYTLIALPLRIKNGDGSPVRAVLLKE